MSAAASKRLRAEVAALREQIRERGLVLDFLVRDARGEYPKRRRASGRKGWTRKGDDRGLG